MTIRRIRLGRVRTSGREGPARRPVRPFREVDRAEVVGFETVEEAHDRQVRSGRLRTRKVPLRPEGRVKKIWRHVFTFLTRWRMHEEGGEGK